MVFSIGADHRGLALKEVVKRSLSDAGYQVVDLGSSAYDENDDYPSIARAVAEKVSRDPDQNRGVLVCGSGAGVALVANKFANVRAALACSPDHAFDLKHDDDINILCLAADYVSEETARKIIAVWLETPFSGEERFARRIREIGEIESDIIRTIETNAAQDALKRRQVRFDL